MFADEARRPLDRAGERSNVGAARLDRGGMAGDIMGTDGPGGTEEPVRDHPPVFGG